MLRRVIPVVYLLIGVLIGSQHGYFTSLNTLPRVFSALLAVLLWPLVLVGVNLTLR